MIDAPSTGLVAESDALATLRAENARLIALLQAHGIEWRSPPASARPAAAQDTSRLSTQAMRRSVWDKHRVTGCAENYPQHIALPRGCLDPVLELFRDNAIGCDFHDERYSGEHLDVDFAATLRLAQEAAVAAMLHQDTGVLCAPTAYDKTVVAAAMIARRRVNTLILVQRTDLL